MFALQVTRYTKCLYYAKDDLHEYPISSSGHVSEYTIVFSLITVINLTFRLVICNLGPHLVFVVK